MDLDILEAAQLVSERDSEDEDSGEEVGGLEDDAPTTPLDGLKLRVEENLRLLQDPSPVDASPLSLANLREKFPQVIW